jgi:DNA-binding CsgD family transcriptional regulator
MVQETAPLRRHLGALGKMQRRKRIFARLREGGSYEEIAAEEGVSRERVRQIVSEVLQKRSVDSGADHAKLQLDRLLPAMQLAAEGIASGDVSAITPYLKVIDRLDRYQAVAGRHQVYDDEARKKLMDRINSMAENFGIDEAMWKARRDYLEKTGKIPDNELDETDAVAGPADPAEAQQDFADPQQDLAQAQQNLAEAPQDGQSEAANWMSV